MAFDDNIVDEIKNRCNIVDVIGKSVKLRKTGVNMIGLCPFHNEKTPSFVVSEKKQNYNCYGCGAHGDVIEFVQRYNNLNFIEAIEKLAEEYGIEHNKNAFDTDKKRVLLYEANREAAVYYYKMIMSSANPGAAYMIGRGFDRDTIKAFGIGYADGEWDSLYLHLKDCGVSEQTMLSLGLISQKSNKYFDKYRDRIMFPIINTRGKIIGFGGRTITDAKPKYINSSESRIFSKQYNLYGINTAKDEILKEGLTILVEGYMDVISLYQAGIKNVAATLGTALTEGQAKILKRYSDNVVLAYDSDAAGRSAAVRGMEVLNKAGCKVKILLLENAKDPDEYIKSNGQDAFLKEVKNAIPLTDFKIQMAREGKDIDSTEDSVRFLKEAADILKKTSPVEAEIYIKKIAKETGISEGAIRAETFGSSETSGVLTETDETEVKTTDKESQIYDKNIERYFIRLSILGRNYFEEIIKYKNAFETPAIYRIFETIDDMYSVSEEIDMMQLTDSLSENDQDLLDDIMQNIPLADKSEKILVDCIEILKLQKIQDRKREISTVLKTISEKDPEKIKILSEELIQLQNDEQMIKNKNIR